VDAFPRHYVNALAKDFRCEFSDSHELEKSETIRLVVVKKVDVRFLISLAARHRAEKINMRNPFGAKLGFVPRSVRMTVSRSMGHLWRCGGRIARLRSPKAIPSH
jgi:hypothetical protein